MAERSFRTEVGKLRLGAGEVFRGEGILAVTKALLQSGVSYEDPFDLDPDAQGSGITVSLSIASKTKSTIRGYLMQTCQGYTRA